MLMEHFQWQFGSQTDRAVTGNDSVGGVPWWILLRQGKYKYIRTLVADEIEELYDLEADPQELYNLAVEAKHRSLLKDYRERMVAELRRTDAKLLPNLPTPRVADSKK
jgi:arylsulfatase A-like enzyme